MEDRAASIMLMQGVGPVSVDNAFRKAARMTSVKPIPDLRRKIPSRGNAKSKNTCGSKRSTENVVLKCKSCFHRAAEKNLLWRLYSEGQCFGHHSDET